MQMHSRKFPELYTSTDLSPCAMLNGDSADSTIVAPHYGQVKHVRSPHESLQHFEFGILLLHCLSVLQT